MIWAPTAAGGLSLRRRAPTLDTPEIVEVLDHAVGEIEKLAHDPHRGLGAWQRRARNTRSSPPTPAITLGANAHREPQPMRAN